MNYIVYQFSLNNVFIFGDMFVLDCTLRAVFCHLFIISKELMNMYICYVCICNINGLLDDSIQSIPTVKSNTCLYENSKVVRRILNKAYDRTAPITHALQPVGDCLATKRTAATNATTVRSKLHFSVADQSASGRRQISLKIDDHSATGGRLIVNWLKMGCDWSATSWWLVGDRSEMGLRLTIDQTICYVGVIMNKALINCYSMAINISITSYCLFLGYFTVRI